ncbi:hypothetical protein GQ457_07G011210 [Hibiscus cannabinus]
MVIDIAITEPRQEEFQFAPKPVSFELSKFDGTNPEIWIAHAEAFFKFYQTEDALRISMAAYHFEGIAGRWYQWMKRYQQLSNWKNFTRAMRARFQYVNEDSSRTMKEQKLSTETLQDVAKQLALLADQLNWLIKTNEEIGRSGNLGDSRDTFGIDDSYVFDEVSESVENDIEDNDCIVKGKTQIMNFTDYDDQLQVSQLMEQTSNLRYANMIFGGNVEPIQGNLTGTLNLNLAPRKILNSHVPVMGTDMSEKMMGIDLIIGVKVLNFAEGVHAMRGTFGPSQVHDTSGEEIQNDATTMQGNCIQILSMGYIIEEEDVTKFEESPDDEILVQKCHHVLEKLSTTIDMEVDKQPIESSDDPSMFRLLVMERMVNLCDKNLKIKDRTEIMGNKQVNRMTPSYVGVNESDRLISDASKYRVIWHIIYEAASSISRAFEEFNPCIILIVGQQKEFEGKKLVPTTKEGSKLVKSEDEKQKNEALKEKFEVIDEYSWTSNMDEKLRVQFQEDTSPATITDFKMSCSSLLYIPIFELKIASLFGDRTAIMQHPGNELEGDVLRTLETLVALDFLVLGEGQVLAQIKQVVKVARGVIGDRRRALEGDIFLEGGMSYFEMQGLFEKVKLQRTISASASSFLEIPRLVALIEASSIELGQLSKVAFGLPSPKKNLKSLILGLEMKADGLENVQDGSGSTAESKRAAIIILPFHKNQRFDAFTFSVGILVDRGLGGTSHVSASNVSYLITVLFFGGLDDCEALAYGARMAEHPGISLNIIRFVVEPETIGEISTIDMQENSGIKTSLSEEEFLSQIRRIQKNGSVRYEEKAVRNVTETIAAIRGAGHCNLFLVGRMPEGELALALRRRSECPELGPVGSLLTSPDFSMTASVLVIQQYNGYISLNLASDMEEESPGKDSESN